MKKYDFLANVQKYIDAKDEQKKKLEIGKILSALQRPAQEVVELICIKQKQDVDKLYDSLGWNKSK